MTSSQTIPLTEQVRQALATFLQAHESAEVAAAVYYDAKRRAGSNEKERTKICADVGDEHYALYLMDLTATESAHKAAVAHLERTEKELNVLRELLNHEAEQTRLRAADRYHEAMTIADLTAQRYAVMPGNYTTHAEFRARYATPAGNGIKRATTTIDDSDASELPF